MLDALNMALLQRRQAGGPERQAEVSDDRLLGMGQRSGRFEKSRDTGSGYVAVNDSRSSISSRAGTTLVVGTRRWDRVGEELRRRAKEVDRLRRQHVERAH